MSREPLVPDEPATLVGLLDGLLDGGVHVAGDLAIGIADVELIRVALRLLVASEETASRTGTDGPPASDGRSRQRQPGGGDAPVTSRDLGRAVRPSVASTVQPTATTRDARLAQRPRAGGGSDRDVSGGGRRAVDEADREQLVRGVSQLVLTVVAVVHDLVERQAIRRVEAGSLTDDQVERLGVALQALEERMGEVKEVLGFTDDELNLDLGPLGRLR